jgi:thiosulfate/3-mercaptopyruvate sulfurtransferase
MNLQKIRLTVWSALFLLILLTLAGTANAIQVPGPLVDTEWLAKHLEQVVVLDVRANKASFEKKARGAEAVNPCGVGQKKKETPIVVSGHVPGAVLVMWKDVRQKQKIDGKEIKGQVLDKAAFEKLMQKSGVNNDSAVVVTGGGQNPTEVLMATRLYWMLKYYGHDNVALHDGGMRDWIVKKQPAKYGRSRAKSSNYKAGEPRAEMLASSEDVAKAIADDGVQLVDSRGLEDYLGLTYHRKLTKPDRKGHIPGAKSWPITTLVDTKSTAVINSEDDMRQVAKIMDIDVEKPTITYCYSGAQGTLSWFVMHELLGNKNTRLYDGSMHEWIQDPKHKTVRMKIE